MRLSAQEEYGLRCLVQVARRSPGPDAAPTPIRDVAAAEGLSVEYAAKLLRVLRQADLLLSARGAAGGYVLARDAASIPVADVLAALDGPLWDDDGCAGHPGQLDACVHTGACTINGLWVKLGAAIDAVLRQFTLADLLEPAPSVPTPSIGATP